MEHNLVDEALGLGESSSGGSVVLIEDCVETAGAFVLHHLLKRSLSLPLSTVIFVSFAHPFSHYDRILRKMGCNLAAQRDNKRFLFLDMLTVECPGEFVELYGKIQGAVEANLLTDDQQNLTVMIDDISLMEVVANGFSNHVLNFLHYCHSLTTEFGCSLVLLHHGDVYASTDSPYFNLQIESFADVIIKAEPLATGLASDVHGQLTVVKKGSIDGRGGGFNSRMNNFHFRVRENCVEYFHPGSRT